MIPHHKIEALKKAMEGDLHVDKTHRAIYATDASVYKEYPIAIAIPKNKKDIQTLVQFANSFGTSLIPRAAGTSLAGQCVGSGIVVDVSKYMNQIVRIDPASQTVTVQPGVIRDELNKALAPHQLFFGPETSTANRAMIGGMVGNNSCGANSIVYGSTRDYLLEAEAILSDGSVVKFGPLSEEAYRSKCLLESMEGTLYRQVDEVLSNPSMRAKIEATFPKKSIHRRNTGYALDVLMDANVLGESDQLFNFCKLLAGSEGTLAFITEITLSCTSLPPKYSALICPHFSSLKESLIAVGEVMKHKPYACELMDRVIMDCTKDHIEYSQYRFFIHDNPEAILMVELRHTSKEELEKSIEQLISNLKQVRLGYAFSVVYPPDSKKIWALRKAGLGLLANIPGDKKAVAVVEDTAVALEDLPAYIEEFTRMMEPFGQKAVYYAHAGAGELHLRPVLNLKDQKDVDAFSQIAQKTAELVKKYNGSLSGEHGDGRVRAPFLKMMIGEELYQVCKAVKNTWDPGNVFNPGKIIDAPDIDSNFRHPVHQKEVEVHTMMDFSDAGGFLRMAEKCNGSGDCRKRPFSGGTMCPSYMATLNEKDTTRARANALREFYTHSDQINKLSENEVSEILDLCLSCKGCKSECPSNVDMAALKSEWQYQERQRKFSFRQAFFAYSSQVNQWGSYLPSVANFFTQNSVTSFISKKLLGISSERTLPLTSSITLKKWWHKNRAQYQVQHPIKTVYVFADEFTDTLESHIGIRLVQLLTRLRYQVIIPAHKISGRALISKGMLKEAKDLANENIQIFNKVVDEDHPLIGIEPSAILTFRDEYLRLASPDNKKDAEKIAKNTFLIDEFLADEVEKGNIRPEAFHREKKEIVLHGHCHQKALSSVEKTASILSLPANYTVQVIPSGCCGMAGSFGYEKEHYALSMQIGELVLFPFIRKTTPQVHIAAPGTSCRHQIKDGTARTARHPIEILYEALK